jgi:hypothetical protein
MSYLVQERWHRKLENWALWKVGQSRESRGGRPGDWWNCPPRPPQPLVGEASDVDGLVEIMKYEGEIGKERFQAIDAWYLWTYPETYGARADALRIHPDTLADRVRAARYRLEELEDERRRRQVKVPRSYAMAAD